MGSQEAGPPEHLPGHDLDELTLRAMMRSTRFIRQIMEPFFNGLGISLSQWVVMSVMLRHEDDTGGPIRLVDLCGRLMIRQPTLTAVINKLLLLGFVERAPRPEACRGRFVSLSPEGRALAEKAHEMSSVNIQCLFRVWNDDDKERILDLFERLENHLMSTIRQDAQSGRGRIDDKGNASRGKS